MAISRKNQSFAIGLASAKRRLGRRVYFEARALKGIFSKQDGPESVPNESGPIPGSFGTLDGASDYLSPLLDELHTKILAATLSRDDLKTLRSRSFVLAARFAQSVGIVELIRPASTGFGFLIEIPGTPIRDECGQRGWWMLASLSDGEMKLSEPFEAVVTEKGKLLAGTGFGHVGAVPDLGSFCHRFLLSPRMLSNRAYKDLVHLIDCCRFMRTHFPETILWDRPTVDRVQQSAVFVGAGSDGGQHP